MAQTILSIKTSDGQIFSTEKDNSGIFCESIKQINHEENQYTAYFENGISMKFYNVKEVKLKEK
jgi:hypothetical protein